jgi:NADPH-dependent F420 reductase
LTGSIGLIGGTGPEGKGLAARFAHAGLEVFLGSRSPERGEAAAEEVRAITGGRLMGGGNGDAARAGEVVVIAVPYSGMGETLAALADDVRAKIVISAVVPLQFSRARIAALDVPDGSAAQEAQRLLPAARVTAAFHNLPAGHLLDVAHPIDGDVIVCADDAAALRETIELAALIEGVRGVNGGPLANSRYVEELTALILNINRIHKAEAHIKLVGL